MKHTKKSKSLEMTNLSRCLEMWMKKSGLGKKEDYDYSLLDVHGLISEGTRQMKKAY